VNKPVYRKTEEVENYEEFCYWGGVLTIDGKRDKNIRLENQM